MIPVASAIPARITPQEQARYNYRSLQATLAGYGWRHDKAQRAEITLRLPVDHRGLIRTDTARAPHAVELTAYADQYGWIIDRMRCDITSASAQAYFRRTAVSVFASQDTVLTESWEYMAAPLTAKKLAA